LVQLVEALRYKLECRGFVSPLRSFESVIGLILPDILLPWGRPNLWRKWVKAAGA
jgi:hypothetical protein